tara:strand:- start:337 stop:1197 length:861 start_codon:yes stop_codon:yes gene_type:complete
VNSNKKKILILGCSGRLGGHIKLILNKKKYNIFYHEGKADKNFNNEDNLYKYLTRINPDIIINTIALSDIEYCEKNPIEAFMINTMLPQNLSEWIKDGCEKLLLHISTDHIYDGKTLNKEDGKISLKNIYATTKYFGEWYANKCNSIILRTNFFGKTVNHSKPSFTDWLCVKLKSKQKILLYNDVFFNPIHINTLAQLIEIVINNPKIGVFNVGSKNGTSKYDFGKKINELKGYKNKNIFSIKYKNTGNLVNRPYDMRTNVSKFEKTYKLQMPQLKIEIKKVLNDD